MRTRKDRRRGESGQIIVLWAVGLIAIVLFVALAIDLGNVAQVHQNAQDAADSAALDGAQLWAAQTNTKPQVVTDVESYVTTNYPQMKTPADWTTCTGSLAPPSGFTAVAGEDCVSFDGYIVNVAIPPQLVQFWLGSVGGVNGTGVAASATASAQAPGGFLILPIGITTTAAGGGLWCIKGGSSGSNCVNNVAAGDRGPLDSPRLRVFTGAKESGHGQAIDVLELDLAVGVDHNLNIFNAGNSSQYCDADGGTTGATTKKCTDIVGATGQFNGNSAATYDLPSAVWNLSGSTNSAENGLVDGDTGVDNTDGGFTLAPRLAHADGYTATGTNSATANPPDSPSTPYLVNKSLNNISYSGNLNGRQISYYLESANGAPVAGQSEFTKCFPGLNPSSTPVDQTSGGNDVWATDDSCLSTDLGTGGTFANGNNGPIFASSIASSPRFGFVPVVSNCGGGSSDFCEIVGFEAVYFDVINIQGNNLSATAWVFDPKLIQDGPAPPGQGGGQFTGNGLFVVNLCSITKGNC